jgi:hypothetical protein
MAKKLMNAKRKATTESNGEVSRPVSDTHQKFMEANLKRRQAELEKDPDGSQSGVDDVSAPGLDEVESESTSAKGKVERRKIRLPEPQVKQAERPILDEDCSKPAYLSKKKPTFHETHTRVTTYLENALDHKLKQLKMEAGISVTTVINAALKEHFEKYNL